MVFAVVIGEGRREEERAIHDALHLAAGEDERESFLRFRLA